MNEQNFKQFGLLSQTGYGDPFGSAGRRRIDDRIHPAFVVEDGEVDQNFSILQSWQLRAWHRYLHQIAVIGIGRVGNSTVIS